MNEQGWPAEGEAATGDVTEKELMRYKSEKYTLLKGCEGFGDRLQCLLQAIEYCKKTGRTLIVDWEDEHWCHEEGKGFDYYFSISGLKQIDPGLQSNNKRTRDNIYLPKAVGIKTKETVKNEENYKNELTGETEQNME